MTGSPDPPVIERWAHTAEAEIEHPIPAEVIERAKEAVLDYLGVAVAGARVDVVRSLDSLALDAVGAGTALRIGRGRSSLDSAALTNAAAGHALELDDGCRAAAGHPGTVVIPAALASAEASACDGPRLLRAVVLGYEVFIGLGEAVNPAHLKRGFHTTATVGPLAAAMAAAVAGGQDEAAIARSLSLAGLMGAGLLEVTVDGAAAKTIQVGRAAAAGVFAAMLSGRGIGGPRRVIEGESGFMRAMAGSDSPQVDTAVATSAWRLSNAYVKRHACCRHTHAAIDAALELRGRLGAGRVASAQELRIATYDVAARLCGGPAHPQDIDDARFSIPFTVALAIKHARLGPTAFTHSSLGDSAVAHLSERVSVVVDPRLEAVYPDRRGAIVSLTFADGRIESAETMSPRGEPENPLSREELEEKFVSTTAFGGLPPERCAALKSLVAELDRLDRGAAVLDPLQDWKV